MRSIAGRLLNRWSTAADEGSRVRVANLPAMLYIATAGGVSVAAKCRTKCAIKCKKNGREARNATNSVQDGEKGRNTCCWLFDTTGM